MTEPDLSRAEWHKSSYSSQDGNCVEVARNLPGIVAIRDSKDPNGAMLVIAARGWHCFIRGISNTTPSMASSSNMPRLPCPPRAGEPTGAL